MATIAITSLPVVTTGLAGDVIPVVQSGVTSQITNANLFGSVPSMNVVGFIGTTAIAPTVASSVTITPLKSITFISGTLAVATISVPSNMLFTGGSITLIPTGVFTWTTAGNIALAGTAVVNKALIMTYDYGTGKWYPSYT